MKEWYSDEAFWRALYPFMFPPERWESTPDEVDNLLRLLEIEPPASVLDIPCGPGRHTLELARRGFRVTGVDRTEFLLEKAKAFAEKDGLDVEIVTSDMREFQREGAYDAALNLFTSFGYFKDPADDGRVLGNLYVSLKPGGCLVMEMMGREVLKRIFQKRGWEEQGGAFLLEERSVSDDWSWIENRWIVVQDGHVKEFCLSHRLYSGESLTEALHEAGFREITLYGGLDGSPYNDEAKRLVAAARK